MSTATKDADIKENVSSISRHEMEQLLDLAENLQAKYTRSKSYYQGILAFSTGFIGAFLISIGITMKYLFGDTIDIPLVLVLVLYLIEIIGLIYVIVILQKSRSRISIDRSNFQSVLDMVEEAQRQYAHQMTPVEKAVFGIRLRNLDFDGSQKFNLSGA